jgi:O-antigen ligase
MISRAYPRILAVYSILAFFTGLSSYLFLAEKLTAPPLYWIIALVVAAMPICLSPDSLSTILRSPLALWGYAFVMISGVWLLFETSPSEVVLQEFRTRVLSVIFIVTLLLVFSREDTQLWARRATFVAVLLGVGLNFYELFHPLTFSAVTGRSAGLYVNPTQSAAALTLGLIISLKQVKPALKLLFALVVGMGVFLTFSRAGVIGWGIVLILLVKTKQVDLRRSAATAVVISILAILIAVWQWDALTTKLADLNVLNANVINRISFFKDARAEDFSADERKQVAALAWEMFSENPILGHGVGASVDWSYEQSSHNEYLNLMVDHGILGFFILPFLVLAVIWRSDRECKQMSFVFAVFILFMGFFSHNILSERHFLISFALFATMSKGDSLGSVVMEVPLESYTHYHQLAR